MPTVILPDKWLKQPTGPVCLDPTHWAYPALVFALCPTDDGAQAQFRQRDLVSGQYLTNYGVDIGPTSDGVALSKTPNLDQVLAPDSAALSTPKMIVVARTLAGSGVGDGGPIHKRNFGGNGWNLHVKFAALTSNNYPVFCFYDGVAWRQAQGTADIRGTGWHTLVGSYDGATVRLAVDGTVSSSSFTGSIPDTAATLKIGGDGETGNGTATTLAYILDGAKIANHEIAVRELASAPWSVFKRDRRRLYIIPAAGGATALTVQDMAQGHSFGTVSLTEHAAITVQALSQAHSLGSPTLTQHNVLAVDAVGQAHTIGSPSLVQHNVLAVDALAQGHTLGVPTLTQHNVLVVQGMAQDQTLGAPSLTQHNVLSVDGLTQAQTIGNIALAIAGVLAVADVTQAQSLGAPSLTQHNVLSVDALTQAQALEAASLTQHYVLSVQAILQAHAMGNVTLTPLGTQLLVNGLAQGQVIGTPSLTQHNVLVVQGMTQAQLLQAVTLGGLVIGSLEGTIVAYALLDGDLVAYNALAGTAATVH